MTRLELRLLGHLQVQRSGNAVTSFESNKVRALLGCLAAEAPRPQSRESLAELLWPGWPQQSAMSNLRYALADLRKNIGDRDANPPYLRISREEIQLNVENDVWVDTTAFCQAIGQAEMQEQAEAGTQVGWLEAADLYQGSFLAGLVLAENEDFTDWLSRKRAYYQQQALRAMHMVASHCERSKEYGRGLHYARRALEIEPWLEEAHQQVMRLLAFSGQRGAALAQYEECERALKKEFGADPAQDTRQLYQQVLDGSLQNSTPGRQEPAAPGEAASSSLNEAHNPRSAPHIPLALTSFIGREAEIAALRKLVVAEGQRLVTLTGAGGVGKTRLVQVAAREMADHFPDGVWYVELAKLANPNLLLQAVVDAANIRQEPGKSLLDSICAFCSDRQALLVLDNCEHVAAACTALVQALLACSPRLTVIATSRVILGVDGEAVFYVPSLQFPSPTVFLEEANILTFEAVRLFVERARLVLPDFTLTPENLEPVARICQRLDGIPLAIELAAARVRLLSVHQIAERLDDAFHLLTSGHAELPRHRTLRAMIDWSYNLLAEEDRALLQVLSVFYGGWDLEAAEIVAKSVGCQDVLDGLGRLVDHSLVQVSGVKTRRYHMLETIRHYAREQVTEPSKMEQARAAHLDYFRALAEKIEPELTGPMQVAWMEKAEQELPNLRAALDWALLADLESGMRLVAALNWFWIHHGREKESTTWLDQALSAPGAGAILPEVQARALAASGYQHIDMGFGISDEEIRIGMSKMEKSLDIHLSLGDAGKAGAAFAHLSLAKGEMGFGNFQVVEAAEAHAQEAMIFYQESTDLSNKSDCIVTLGNIQDVLHNDSVLAVRMMEEALAMKIEIGDIHGIGYIYLMLGNLAWRKLDLPKAREYFEKSADFICQAGDWLFYEENLCVLGRISYVAGDFLAGLGYYHQVEEKGREIKELAFSCKSFCGQGFANLLLGNIAEARRYIEKAAACALKLKDERHVAYAGYLRGVADWLEGSFQKSEQAFTKTLDWIAKNNTFPREWFNTAYVQWMWGTLLFAAGRDTDAEPLFDAAIQYYFQTEQWTNIARPLDGLSCLAADWDAERAARLFGAAEKINPYVPNQLFPRSRASREDRLARVRAALGEERMAALKAEGREMQLEAAVAYALEKPVTMEKCTARG